MNTQKQERIILGAIFIFILILIGIIAAYFWPATIETEQDNIIIDSNSTDLQVVYDVQELDSTWKEENVTKIQLQDDQSSVEGEGVSITNNVITITSQGNYYLTGTLSTGNIIINASDDAEVRLILAGVNITSNSTAVINGVNAKKVTITVQENTTNYLQDASSYTVFSDTEKQEPDATIFTKTDLVINGTGMLQVTANYLDGIASKDGLKIIDTNINIKANDDGIRGKDYVCLKEATVQIQAMADGIKSTDTTGSDVGYMMIENSSISIIAKQDGIQAESILQIKESNLTITTQGEEKIHTEQLPNGRGINANTTTTSQDIASSKGIKASNEITIESGIIAIDASDDAIHSNGKIIIKGGTFKLASGDDGIHADTNIAINGGNITISESYEGIESGYIEITGGDISIHASDDGINVAESSESSSTDTIPGQNDFRAVGNSNQKLVIKGGLLSVTANGDGLDSNGSIEISGGEIIIAGPTSGANGILDYDNSLVITGGSLMGYGSSGMDSLTMNNATQYMLSFQVSGNKGDKIILKDSNGKECIQTVTTKEYSTVIISLPILEKGKTYSLFVNEIEESSLTIENLVTGEASDREIRGRGKF